MPPRKQPAKAVQPKEEPKQIEVKEEPKELEYSIKVNPDLYERMMKIGSQEFWQHVLENYYHELAKRYRR